MRRFPRAFAYLSLLAILALGCGNKAGMDDSAVGILSLPSTLSSHQEVLELPTGELLPVVLGRSSEVGLCFEAAAGLDTSQWRARLTFEGPGKKIWRPKNSTASPPISRLDAHLCFKTELPLALGDGSEIRLCAEVEDAFDDRKITHACHLFIFRQDLSRHRELEEEAKRLVRQHINNELPLDQLLLALDQRGGECLDQGFPMLAVTVTLMGVNFLRTSGSPGHLAEARRRLLALPAWTEQPQATFLLAEQTYELARLDLIEGELRLAVQGLRQAAELHRRVGSSKWLWPIVWEANIMGRAGIVREAVARLGGVLKDCENNPCHALPVAVESQLFQLIQDPEATAEELEAVRVRLQKSLGERDGEDSIDLEQQANLQINLAHLALRLDQDPQPLLDQAEASLHKGSGEGRAALLSGWARLVRALYALEQGSFKAAKDLCTASPEEHLPSSLDAWMLVCEGQALRGLQRLPEAARAFEQAMHFQGSVTLDKLEQDLSLGPSQRAEAYFRAARVEVERGNPKMAWEILSRLDGLAANEEERRLCKERLKAEDPESWRQDLQRLKSLEVELKELERPTSGLRRRQQEAQRRGKREELQELTRRRQAECGAGAASLHDRGLRLRAFALADEVILLHQDPQGRIRLQQRRPIDRRQLLHRIAQIQKAFVEASLDDRAWRELLAPLAELLIPQPLSSLTVETSFALHGALQGVPLAALPITASSEGGPRWLGEATTVTLRPAGGRSFTASPLAAAGSPLFVVNPGLDLLSGAELAGTYQGLFPAARILYGGEATVSRLRDSIEGALWLHVDAHGDFLPAFPELSRILLADADLHLYELEDLSLPALFVNLSGCQTGRWPTTADSGHYGFAGLFARRGVGWVIATRADLRDGTAKDFNSAFYTALSRGKGVREAYGDAMAQVRRDHPARDWAALLLLRGATDSRATDSARVTD